MTGYSRSVKNRRWAAHLAEVVPEQDDKRVRGHAPRERVVQAKLAQERLEHHNHGCELRCLFKVAHNEVPRAQARVVSRVRHGNVDRHAAGGLDLEHRDSRRSDQLHVRHPLLVLEVIMDEPERLLHLLGLRGHAKQRHIHVRACEVEASGPRAVKLNLGRVPALRSDHLEAAHDREHLNVRCFARGEVRVHEVHYLMVQHGVCDWRRHRLLLVLLALLRALLPLLLLLRLARGWRYRNILLHTLTMLLLLITALRNMLHTGTAIARPDPPAI